MPAILSGKPLTLDDSVRHLPFERKMPIAPGCAFFGKISQERGEHRTGLWPLSCADASDTSASGALHSAPRPLRIRTPVCIYTVVISAATESETAGNEFNIRAVCFASVDVQTSVR